MILLGRIFLLLTLLLGAACAQQSVPFTAPQDRPETGREAAWPKNHVLALAYHDVQDVDPDNTFLSVRTLNLLDQLAWLRENGYQAVSIDQILEARQGGAVLPEKAILLSFDDGFSSFRERVLPVLKAYQWPAVLAPVGAWMDTPADQKVDFGGLPVPRERFATRAQIREIADSGLVEIGAHTDNLHFGTLANAQGNKLPAAANRLYDPVTGKYETSDAYKARLNTDIQRISQKIREVTGRSPRVWVWPYGAANGMALEVMDKNGYQMALTLEGGLATVENLRDTGRYLIGEDPSTQSFAAAISGMQDMPAMRVAHVDLDYVYDPDPVQMEVNLGLLIQRIADLRINTVFLQAYADPEGDGTVKELYFPNRHLPMRADLFNRASWQLRTRAGVEIYAWMPVMSFDLDPALPRVTAIAAAGAHDATVDPVQYQRLSPFDPIVRKQIGEIYEDLAGHASFSGLLFHDDALLSDFEDAGNAARQAYADAGLSLDLTALRADPEQMAAWTRFKSQYLIDFTLELADKVKAIRGPQVKTARNIFAMPILEPESEAWFAQNMHDFLNNYDWTAIMAMPLMEGVSKADSDAWLSRLVRQVKQYPDAMDKTLFELQARDWRVGQEGPIDSELLVRWMHRLQWEGVRHFGYYPDDFHTDNPRLELVRPALSNAWSTQR
ncbi:poly-beta-1,6-N-acetyl-D-glucosamine N-deacetylase PgaB [Halopseudomonas pelagia]|uniref:poly-beta-1,6-N-acetyl-D-glucosamine N-deacetylase PgaB n=1 Tax=Halopseudomonas pelagia TaxID=553151 RepID=UPI0030D9D04D|tara:strand:- start:477 stop:2483 length:2007 start_codon:yes stop_codon:yes gene_type:complete